jgi:predicted outer membrane repeat protein
VTISGGNASRIFSIHSGVHATISGVSIANGKESGNNGGAILNNGTLTVTNSTFTGNQVVGGNTGGAIYNGGMLTVINSSFHSNSADQGGGIFSTGTLTVTNGTFSANRADISGRGTIRNTGTATIENTIVGNTTSGGNCSGTFAAGSTNNLADDGTCGSSFRQTTNLALGTLGDYGGTTQTFPLLPGSEAIDAGNASSCQPTDQRGVNRVGTCDIGAFESRGFTLTKTSGDNQSTTINTPFKDPLGVNVGANDVKEPVVRGFVTFTAPNSGASITAAPTITREIKGGTGSLLMTASGTVSLPVTANGIAGTYAVTATTTGVTSTVTYTLTNSKADVYLPYVARNYPPPTPTPTPTPTRTPTPTPTLTPSGTRWLSESGLDEFIVTGNKVQNFKMRLSVPDCGIYQRWITHPTSEVPIVNNNFSFTGTFYASGTFNPATSASGQDGLNGHYIDGCGPLFAGPWPFVAHPQPGSPLIIPDRVIPLGTVKSTPIPGN